MTEERNTAAPETEESRNFILNLIDQDIAEGGQFQGQTVHTRFPPEPNGYLHIGHCKALCIDFGTAEKFGGLCNLRMDDTNPAKEDTEYVDAIQQDIHWLGFDWGDRFFYGSDYFEKDYEYAVELIKKGLAYVCELTPEEFKANRGDIGIPATSPYRDRPIEENLRLFEKMKNGEVEEGKMTLRAKIDLASGNLNLRDPIIYRIRFINHHRQGTKWCIYPMYDFAHPIQDAIEGITHSMCSLEFENHRPLYNWVIENIFGTEFPKQREFARLNMTNTVMSKRYLKAMVDDGTVDGWDDPRMPTIAGIRRRGYTPEAVRDFCERIGVSKANSTVDVGLLEHCVREDLKQKVASRNVVENPVKVIITNYPEEQTEEMELENNREVPEMGNRTVPFSRELYVDGDDFMEVPIKKYFRLFPGNEVRFKGAYFITCNEVVKNEDGSVKELLCTYDPETRSGSGFEGRKVKGTIHWVDAKTAVKIKIRNYDYLMVDDEEGNQVMNPDSLTESIGYAEPLVAEAKPGERFQFFRKGYYIADSKLTNDTEKVFNKIVGLKSSWKK